MAIIMTIAMLYASFFAIMAQSVASGLVAVLSCIAAMLYSLFAKEYDDQH